MSRRRDGRLSRCGAGSRRLGGRRLHLGAVPNGPTLVMGTGRSQAVACLDVRPALPWTVLGRLGTPVLMCLVSGGVATATMAAAFAVSGGNGERYFSVVLSLSIVLLALSNLAVFPALVKLRRSHPDVARPFWVPGGAAGAWLCRPSPPPGRPLRSWPCSGRDWARPTRSPASERIRRRPPRLRARRVRFTRAGPRGRLRFRPPGPPVEAGRRRGLATASLVGVLPTCRDPPTECWPRGHEEKPDYAGLLTYAASPYTQDPTELEGFDFASWGRRPTISSPTGREPASAPGRSEPPAARRGRTWRRN